MRPRSAPLLGRVPRKVAFLALSAVLAAGITGLSLLLTRTQTGRMLELESYDWRVRQSGHVLALDDVVIVRLNSTTLDRFPETGWPIPRTEYADLVDGVMRAGASVVALDLLFLYPDKNGPENDRALANALARYPGRVVLASTFNVHSEDNPVFLWRSPAGGAVPFFAREALLPLECLPGHASCGHLAVVPDLDGVVRRMPVLIEHGGTYHPALSLATAMAYRGIPAGEFALEGSRLRAGSGPAGIDVPLDARACLVPRDFYALESERLRLSLDDVLGAVRGDSRLPDGRNLKDVVGGKIVLLGMGDIVEDRTTTSWNAYTEGVEVHAAYMESLLKNRGARNLPLGGEMAWVFALAGTLSMSALLLPLSLAVVATVLLLAVYLSATVAVLSTGGVVLPVVGPAVAIVLSAAPVVYRRIISGERWRSREDAELRRARSTQRMLLPRERPGVAGADVHGILLPCRDVGGDSYDYFALEGRRLACSLGDVSGKGLPAAMLMSNIQGRLRTQASYLARPADVIRAVNDACSAALEPPSYATMAFAVLDPAARTLTCCLAGHCPPLVVRGDGSTVWLRAGGPPIGLVPDASFEEETLSIGPGDVVVFYSDGITEATDASGVFYGEERLERTARECAGLDAKAAAESILADVEDFSRRSAASDDRTLLILRAVEP